MPETRILESILLTPEEAAEMLRLGRVTVYKLIQTGELASITIGKARRIPRRALDDYIAKRLMIAARVSARVA